MTAGPVHAESDPAPEEAADRGRIPLVSHALAVELTRALHNQRRHAVASFHFESTTAGLFADSAVRSLRRADDLARCIDRLGGEPCFRAMHDADADPSRDVDARDFVAFVAAVVVDERACADRMRELRSRLSQADTDAAGIVDAGLQDVQAQIEALLRWRDAHDDPAARFVPEPRQPQAARSL